MVRLSAALCLLAATLAAAPAEAELDLNRAGVSRLDNGLTVIVLEDNSRPVVSIQMIYRSGSRDETAGKTGLAHFLEHLAFRASERFPNGAATDAIQSARTRWPCALGWTSPLGRSASANSEGVATSNGGGRSANVQTSACSMQRRMRRMRKLA